MRYDPKTFSYGRELEWSDVDRSILIPPILGSWEHGERDIVNTKGKYRGVAADPLGINPPVGGEINTYPTIGWRRQVNRIHELFQLMVNNGQKPEIGPTAHGHIHIHVPGLTEDIGALKRLARYTFENQDDMIRICGRYQKYPEMSASAVQYFKLDGGRTLRDYIVENIESRATNFKEFADMFCRGKDGVSRGRPLRFAINLYCLKHNRTIEFRMFRETLRSDYLGNSFRACELFVDAALNDGPKFIDLVEKEQLTFAPMIWDKELWDGLQKTKHPEDRGKKVRRFISLNGKM